MRHHQSGADGVPPEDLAAYVDGELDFQARRRVESWLAEHPDAAAELESHRQVAGWWCETQPAEPGPAEWERVLAGISSGVQDKHARRASRRRSFFAIAGPLAGIAAAVTLVVLVPRQGATKKLPDPVDTIVFASQGDVTVEHIDPDVDGFKPQFQEGSLPILVPLNQRR